jgi:tRNA(fMet)-specific endonuclease VapC
VSTNDSARYRDHFSVLKYRTGERAIRLNAKLQIVSVQGRIIGTTAINVEEQMRGWLSAIAKERNPVRQVAPYRDLIGLFEFFRCFTIAMFNEQSVANFLKLGAVHIKATDRKIAYVTLANDALLLTANARDFSQVPGLRFENWLD